MTSISCQITEGMVTSSLFKRESNFSKTLVYLSREWPSYNLNTFLLFDLTLKNIVLKLFGISCISYVHVDQIPSCPLLPVPIPALSFTTCPNLNRVLLLLLFGFCPLNPLSVCCMCMNIGPILERGQPLRGHNPEENWLSIFQNLPSTNPSPPRVELYEPHPHQYLDLALLILCISFFMYSVSVSLWGHFLLMTVTLRVI